MNCVLLFWKFLDQNLFINLVSNCQHLSKFVYNSCYELPAFGQICLQFLFRIASILANLFTILVSNSQYLGKFVYNSYFELPAFGQICLQFLLRIASVWADFASCCSISFSLLQEIAKSVYLKLFACRKHLLSAVILRLTRSCPRNAVVSDDSGDFTIN